MMLNRMEYPPSDALNALRDQAQMIKFLAGRMKTEIDDRINNPADPEADPTIRLSLASRLSDLVGDWEEARRSKNEDRAETLRLQITGLMVNAGIVKVAWE